MQRHLSVMVAALMAAALSGCATMSGDECAAGDWTAIGYTDGSRGYTSERFSGYSKACAKHGITPDFQAYRRGRDQGLVEFCQPGRGFSLGTSGGHYKGVCAAELEPEFLDAYRAGHELYRRRADVASANARIQAREQELEQTHASIRAKETALISDETTKEDRIVLIADLVDLSQRAGELEEEIQQLIAERVRFEEELAYYEQTVAAHGY